MVQNERFTLHCLFLTLSPLDRSLFLAGMGGTTCSSFQAFGRSPPLTYSAELPFKRAVELIWGCERPPASEH